MSPCMQEHAQNALQLRSCQDMGLVGAPSLPGESNVTFGDSWPGSVRPALVVQQGQGLGP